uniref:Uncharacterized protein n=1 Tax=Magallana gigas TaxID=29159 RepID=A0A8W8MXI8_MAGGI
MKPQTLFVLVSLIGMLLTLQQAEGVLGNEAVQANDIHRAEIKNPMIRNNGIFGVDGPFRRTRRPRP